MHRFLKWTVMAVVVLLIVRFSDDIKGAVGSIPGVKQIVGA